MKRAVIIFLAIIFISAGTIVFIKSASAKEFRTSGIISNVAADGNNYIATLKADDGKEYTAVTASIPVQKKMLMLENGDKVTVTGSVIHHKAAFNIEVKDILKSN